MFKWILKIGIPALIREAVLDIDTVVRNEKRYYRIRLEALNRVIIDRYVDAGSGGEIDIRIGKGQ